MSPVCEPAKDGAAEQEVMSLFSPPFADAICVNSVCAQLDRHRRYGELHVRCAGPFSDNSAH